MFKTSDCIKLGRHLRFSSLRWNCSNYLHPGNCLKRKLLFEKPDELGAQPPSVQNTFLSSVQLIKWTQRGVPGFWEPITRAHAHFRQQYLHPCVLRLVFVAAPILHPSIRPLSSVLANAFSLPFLISRTILAHFDKSFSAGQMPHFPHQHRAPYFLFIYFFYSLPVSLAFCPSSGFYIKTCTHKSLRRMRSFIKSA